MRAGRVNRALVAAALVLQVAAGALAAGSWEARGVSLERLAQRYDHVSATETEVLLEEGAGGPQCVANVPNLQGVLPSSCCGNMRCPKSDGVCCTGNSHCCPAGHICLQGDPGTPPGCLDVMGRKIPAAVHKLLRKHHQVIKVAKPPAPRAAVPGFRPSGKLNYEDALAPRRRNALATHRIAETTHYHSMADDEVKPRTERGSFVMPNLPGFPTVPASAVAKTEAEASAARRAAEAAEAAKTGKGGWVAPQAVHPTGGGVVNGGEQPVGEEVKAYGTDAVVMLPGEGRPRSLPGGGVNEAQARLEEAGQRGAVASVTNVRAPTTLSQDTMNFREVRPDMHPRIERDSVTEDAGAAALARLFPPDPESATRDPPAPPSEEEQTLARIAKQLEKVNRMRGELRAELRGMGGGGIQIPGV